MIDRTQIADLIERYFTFLHTGDADLIPDLFLAECQLITPGAEGSITHLDLPAYTALVRSRPSPRSAGYPRFGRLLLLDLTGETLALAKVSCAVQPRYFTDYLTLVKKGGDWKIAAKVYVQDCVEA